MNIDDLPMRCTVSPENKEKLLPLAARYGKSVNWMVNAILQDVLTNGQVEVVEKVEIELEITGKGKVIQSKPREKKTT